MTNGEDDHHQTTVGSWLDFLFDNFEIKLKTKLLYLPSYAFFFRLSSSDGWWIIMVMAMMLTQANTNHIFTVVSFLFFLLRNALIEVRSLSKVRLDHSVFFLRSLFSICSFPHLARRVEQLCANAARLLSERSGWHINICSNLSNSSRIWRNVHKSSSSSSS